MSFGSIVPCIYNLHLRMWIRYKCKINSFVEVPTQAELCIDWFNIAFSIVGAAIIAFLGFYHNSNTFHIGTVATILNVAGSILIGIGLGEVKILCSFKMIRSKMNLRNYNYLAPLFFFLVMNQCLAPLPMYQTSFDKIVYHKAKIIFYLVGSVVVGLGLFAIFNALEHVTVHNHSLPLCMNILVVLSTLLLTFLEYYDDNALFRDALTGGLLDISTTQLISTNYLNLILFSIGVILLLLPILITNICRLRGEYMIEKENQAAMRQSYTTRGNRNNSICEF